MGGAEVRKTRSRWGLGAGESSALVLATRQEGVVVVDDYAAITVCRAQSIEYTTTPVLIYEMGKRNLISESHARNKLIALREYAWIAEEVIDTVLSWQERGR